VSREWEPGDVARVKWTSHEATAVRNAANDGWSHGLTFGAGSLHDDISGPEAHPLVVIDPEDPEQVERLVNSLRDEGTPLALTLATAIDIVQAALRSLVADPKPEEPTGLGAVVEDAEGRRWLRLTGQSEVPDHPEWVRPEYPLMGWRKYEAISAVRVLSEGVAE